MRERGGQKRMAHSIWANTKPSDCSSTGSAAKKTFARRANDNGGSKTAIGECEISGQLLPFDCQAKID